ncbi:MAG: helix-turn-helix domain-containing protein [Lachnospiraceae bacterium]|nr:helix-turn-helix domain-containing protein [Lachnospiraceae bacterium]
MEQIESFVTDHNTKTLPFYVELAGITFPDASYAIKRENSYIYVLEYIIDGSGTVEVDGKTFTPSKGDVYLLPRGSNHHYYASKDTPFHKIWMNVNGALCEQLIQLYHLSGKYYFENIDLYDLFKEFLQICKTGASDMKSLFNECSIIFHKIIQRLSKHIEQDTTINEYALLAKDYCNRNTYQKIVIEDVAKHVGLSVSQLNRLFKQEFHSTVYAYLLNNKINTAKALLRGTSMTVSEIAYLLKFTDEHYFTNIFKKKTGMTPTECRKQSQT